MKLRLPELQYAKNAFEPFLSAESFDYHHGKHHKAYIEKTNELLANDAKFSSLDELLLRSEGKLFNQAGQAWNHTFFWHCLSPEKKKPSSSVHTAFQEGFGGFDAFANAFVEAGKSQFGSGWTWFVKDSKGEYSIVTTSNAENPARQGMVPLFVADVWEHAYYIDHRNDRGRFLKQFLEHANWDFVATNIASPKLVDLSASMLEGAATGLRRDATGPTGAAELA